MIPFPEHCSDDSVYDSGAFPGGDRSRGANAGRGLVASDGGRWSVRFNFKCGCAREETILNDNERNHRSQEHI